jgi:hypothetical protein
VGGGQHHRRPRSQQTGTACLQTKIWTTDCVESPTPSESFSRGGVRAGTALGRGEDSFPSGDEGGVDDRVRAIPNPKKVLVQKSWGRGGGDCHARGGGAGATLPSTPSESLSGWVVALLMRMRVMLTPASMAAPNPSKGKQGRDQDCKAPFPHTHTCPHPPPLAGSSPHRAVPTVNP